MTIPGQTYPISVETGQSKGQKSQNIPSFGQENGKIGQAESLNMPDCGRKSRSLSKLCRTQ